MNPTIIKRFIAYFAYTLFLGFVLAEGGLHDLNLKRLAAETYKTSPRVIFNVIFPIIFGILVALPQFYRTWRKQGSWHIDWIKLTAVGIPVLLLTILPLLYFQPSLGMTRFFSLIWGLFGYSLLPVTISGIALGYLVLTSIRKRNNTSIRDVREY